MMMDPLSISATIVGLIASSSAVIAALHGTLERDGDSLAEIEPQIFRFQIANTLLQTISKHLPSNELLPGVDLSVKMCMESLNNILTINEEMARDEYMGNKFISSTHTKRLSSEVDVFADSVASLRNFSQE